MTTNQVQTGVSQFVPITRQEAHHQDVQNLVSLIDQSKIITSVGAQDFINDSDDTGAEPNAEDEHDLEERGSDLGKNLEFQIQCLMDLVPTLELNLALARNRRERESHAAKVPFHASEPAHVYISLVRDKYKEADNRLVERLGEANWQRHVTIRKRIDAMLNDSEQDSDHLHEKDLMPSVLGPSVFHDSGLGTSSAVSHSSFISSNADGGPKAVRVPQMPAKAGLGEPFQCTYCGYIIHDINNRQEWK